MLFVERYKRAHIGKYDSNNLELSRPYLNLKALSNSLRKSSAIFILSVVLISATFAYQTPSSYAASEYNSDFQGLMIPKIEMQPTSGPPGTEVTITVSNFIPVPENTDPRMEFFMTLPFFEFSGNVASNCDGGYCHALYSFDEIQNGNLAPKELTFTLFSEQNPEPTTAKGNLVTDCDVRVNDEIVKSFGYACNAKDTAPGEYEIDFGWAIPSSDKFDWSKTLTFTVTEPSPARESHLPGRTADFSIADINLLFTQYENNLVSSIEFEQKLKSVGWDDNDIHRAYVSVKQWTDSDSLGKYAAPSNIDGLDLLTLSDQKTQFVSEQKEPAKQVKKENVNYDKSEPKSTQQLVMSQEKSSSLASSDSPQDSVYGMIIAGVILAAGLMVAFVKKGII